MPPKAPKNKYKTNYLTQVIFRLDFPPCELIDTSSLKKFKESLDGDDYTLFSIKQPGVTIKNDGKKGLEAQNTETTIWKIENDDQDLMIEIERSSFIIDCKKYTDFIGFLQKVDEFQQKFFETYDGISEITRLGLRYINQLKMQEGNVKWKKYVNEKLTKSLGFKNQAQLGRSMNLNSYTHDEETRINFQFGVYNKYFPAPIKDENNEFIIDIDAFTPTIIEKSNIINIVRKFNSIITEYFETSITDELRGEMGIIDE